MSVIHYMKKNILKMESNKRDEWFWNQNSLLEDCRLKDPKQAISSEGRNVKSDQNKMSHFVLTFLNYILISWQPMDLVIEV